MLWTKKAQLHRNSLRVQVSSWHSALRFQEAAVIATAVMPALFVPFALGHEGPASPVDTAISDSVVARCFSVQGGRASSAGISDFSINFTHCALCSGPRRPSFTRGHCDFGFCRGALLCDSRRPSFTNSFGNCCIGSVIPGGRASPTAFAFLASSGRVESSAPGQEDPASPEDSSTSDPVAVLYCAIPRARASPAQNSARSLTWRSLAWSCATTHPGR